LYQKEENQCADGKSREKLGALGGVSPEPKIMLLALLASFFLRVIFLFFWLLFACFCGWLVA